MPNTDTTVLLLIAEQHSAILSLRNENTALHQRIHELEKEKAEKLPEEQEAKKASGEKLTPGAKKPETK